MRRQGLIPPRHVRLHVVSRLRLQHASRRRRLSIPTTTVVCRIPTLLEVHHAISHPFERDRILVISSVVLEELAHRRLT